MNKTKGTYISFLEGEANPKTRKWLVVNTEVKLCPIPLGVIKWHGAWRKYCFFPEADTLFEQVCLREIADFIEGKTLEHKRTKREETLLFPSNPLNPPKK